MRPRNRVFAVPVRTTWRPVRVFDPHDGFSHVEILWREVWGPSANRWPRVDVVTWYRFGRRPAPRRMRD